MSKKRNTTITQITQDDVEDLAFGCALLGTGGGGSVSSAILEVKSAIRKFGPVSVVQLEDVAEDGLVLPICGIGAPTVSFEMLNNGGEAHLLRQEVERVFNNQTAYHPINLDIIHNYKYHYYHLYAGDNDLYI